MNIFVRNNVDYTPLFWLWVAASLVALVAVFVEVKASPRRHALKRVRPMIEEFLGEGSSTLTVRDYVKAVEVKFGDRQVWLQIHTREQLAPLHMVENKTVELAS